MKKLNLIVLILIAINQTYAYAERDIVDISRPILDIVLEEVKFDCSEFKPNLITKFLWKEGPTRGLLYKKCLDQNHDDVAFVKYNEAMINDSNIVTLPSDINEAKTRLTILTLTTALKNYLMDTTDDSKTEIIKSSINKFKEHYKEKKAMLDVEIKSMKKKENPKAMELINIVESNEAELDEKILSTLKYMDFVIKDKNSYVLAHSKFIPYIFNDPDKFKKSKLSKYECSFMAISFDSSWDEMKEDLQITCLRK